MAMAGYIRRRGRVTMLSERRIYDFTLCNTGIYGGVLRASIVWGDWYATWLLGVGR